jgi:hypothetical protein
VVHSWIVVAGAVLIGLVVARTVFGAVGKLLWLVVAIGLLALGAGTAAGGLSGLQARADCVQEYPQLGSGLVNELEHGCRLHPAPAPAVLAARLRRQGIGARAVTGAQVRGLHLAGNTAVPAGVVAAVVPTQSTQRFVVLYTTGHATAERVERQVSARLRQAGIGLSTYGSHLGVDGSVVYLDATSATQTPVTNAVTGI